ncbi:EAL domain-containing protein [Uliginosibacterium sp. H3]|uniref:EAL domain-containing protein n=1 Tax=Uliginosibacterium silvisoli TaxID=3114758 RepID=A0ABU6K1K4_9RHOO|nr:EAL domain-containing protein [Uliginosibacterium sp. H3]
MHRATHSRAVSLPGPYACLVRLFVCCTLFLAGTPGFAAPPSQAAPAATSALRVTMDDNYPPYVFRDSRGKLNGYLVDVWALWSQKTGIRVDLVATDWDLAKMRMATGEADVIDTIFQTPERERSMDFTKAYAQIPVAIFNHVSIGGITNLENLRGFLVGVKAGDACIGALEKAGAANLLPYPSYEALVRAAAGGQVRVFCMDEPPANYLLYREHVEGEFHKAFELESGAFHRAVHKGDAATLALVEKGFATISESELNALHDKWMGRGAERSHYARMLGYGALAALLVGSVLVLWGVTLRRQVKQRTFQLDRERSRLRTLVETIPDMVWLKDPQGVFLECNPVFERFLGVPEREIIGKTDYDFVDQELADFFRENDRKAALADRPSVNEEWLTFAGDKYRGLFETIKTPLRDAEGKLIGVLGIARDITQRKTAEDEIRQLAFFDSLTCLPNRRLLLDRLQHAVTSSARSKRMGALLFIDLDHFKFLNDAQGHDKGDLLLCEVARRLRACCRDSDTVARFGGDEFVVLLEDIGEQADAVAAHAELLGEKILRTLREIYVLDGREHHTTSSIGVTLVGGSESSVDDLLRHADMAMYTAKAAGRNTLRFFDPHMQATVTARITLDADLRQALQQEELLLHYQAQVDGNGRVTGAEALLRWRHPERGMVSPAEFIPLAEESGLILPIGAWVLAEACNQLVAWARQPELAHLSLAVNVSARQFHQPGFVQEVLAVLEETGADPHRLKLELTESMLSDDVEDIIAKMEALKVHGVSFALDDFGTGYSSLTYLKRLPLYQLKIDQSFVRDILSNPHDAAIARAIVVLAQSLGLGVIAEGVETQAQREFLANQGCTDYQGYLFSKPLPAEAFGQLFQLA